MSLTPGTRLGPYDIQAAIGAGGMGEVYRARDTRLGRDVAIKVLPASVASDPERLSRFEQEARAAAALNHPNILALYDIGSHNSAPYLVTELLEGETLRDRLTTGPLAVRKVVEYAAQIAHGLAAAHERGIVHRDLKPENVFVTEDGRVKILDFGLAKLIQPEPAFDASALPTTPPNTVAGMVLGTIGYMSPEQVRGSAADHRSDIFALGVVLYEMLSGRRAFHGDTAIETMSAILKEDPPDLPTTDRHIPPGLARIVDRCLEKSPAARFKSADDLAFALEAVTSHSGSVTAIDAHPSRTGRERIAWAAAALATAAALLSFVTRGPARVPIDQVSIAFEFQPPDGTAFQGSGGNAAAPFPAVSPDGRSVAFQIIRSGQAVLAIRDLASLETRLVAGSEGSVSPSWSSDSRSLVFLAAGKLKRFDIGGGPPRALTDIATQVFGMTWNAEDILLGNGSGTILRVSASGGPPVSLTRLAADETGHLWPDFLPDGRRFLYVSSPSRNLYLASLDGGESRRLFNADSKVLYSDGYLVFLRDGTLMAQEFDAASAELRGQPQSVAAGVAFNQGTGNAAFSISDSGVLAYRSGVGRSPTNLVWLDRAGKRIGQIPGEFDDRQVDLAPDDERVAVDRFESSGGTARDIWIIDSRRGTSTRWTSEPSDDCCPIWSPDGLRIVFPSLRAGQRHIYEGLVDSSGSPSPVLETPLNKFPKDLSRDGRYLVYELNETNGNLRDLWILPLFGDRQPRALVSTRAEESDGRFSPDGNWLAYSSNQSGRNEVYLQRIDAEVGARLQVSVDGGYFPRWRGDGRELFYVTPDRMMATVTVELGNRPALGVPRQLFKVAISDPNLQPFTSKYDVSRDGQRFIVHELINQDERESLTVVVNWRALLAQ